MGDRIQIGGHQGLEESREVCHEGGHKGVLGVIEFFSIVMGATSMYISQDPQKGWISLYTNCALNLKLEVGMEQGKIFRINMSNPEVIHIYMDSLRPTREIGKEYK